MRELAIIDIDNRVKMFHYLRCGFCNSKGDGYVDMTQVLNDFIPQESCPNCGAYQIEIITYKLMDMKLNND